MAIRTWVSNSSTSFTTGTNWNPTTAPTTNDDVVFDGSGTAKAVFASTTLALTSLTFGGASTLDIGTTLSSNRALSATTITVSNGTINIIKNTAGGSVRSLAASGTATLSGGTINLNDSTHTFSGGTGGIVFSGGGTIQGLGTVDGGAGGISGNGGTITATAGNTLSIANGIAGSNTFNIAAGSTLDLTTATSVGSSAFAFTGATGSLKFASTSALTLSGVSVTGVAKGVGAGTQTTVIDFAGGANTDVIKAKFDNTTDVLTVTLGTGTATFQLNDLSGAFANWDATTDTVFVTDTVCYAAGTLIATERGPVAIEDLRAGDQVVTLQNGTRSTQPVKWIGTREVQLSSHPQIEAVAPVRIAQHAFAPNMPSRDLIVSPPHALFVDGKLVPAKLLVNDMTITRAYDLAAVTYYHVELDRHAIILAEDLPAESYLDTGNRSFFRNASVTAFGAPVYHVDDSSEIWEHEACAPLLVASRDILPIWNGLTARATDLGYVQPTRELTTDPDLHLMVDGRRVDAIEVVGRKHRFVVPAAAGEVRMVSRATAPCRIEGWRNDQRRLGVAIRSVSVSGAAGATVIAADHPSLTQGWHAAETLGKATWRWTNGDASLPLAASTSVSVVEVQLADTATYITADDQALRAAA